MKRNQLGGSNLLNNAEETMKNIFLLLVAGATMLSATVVNSAQDYAANFVPYMVTNPELCPDPNLAIHNKDVKGLNMLLNRQMIEMSTSASAQVPEILPPDRTRINSYIAEIEAYQAQINASAPADYPGTHRLYYCLRMLDQPPIVTSQAINDLLIQWTLTVGELNTSSSGLIPAGLREPDNARLSQHVQAMKNYLVYVDASAIQDYPRTNAVTQRIKDSAGIAR